MSLGDDASILAQIFAGQSGSPASPLVQQTVQQAMSQGGLWTKENCSGIVSGKSTAQLVVSTIGGAAIKFAGATGPAAPFVLAAGAILQLFGAIFGHHAAKVKQEQQIICAVVQAVNDSLSVIDQALAQGQVDADGASRSLDQLFTDLQQNVQPILKQDSSHCNAACFILAEARGVIAKRKEQYALILPPQASAACAQGYWNLYPDVAASATYGTAGGAAGAWTHYKNWGKTEGRTWPCDATGATQASASTAAAAISSPVDLVNSLATSTGMPSWAIWGVGALLALKLLR